MCEANAYIMNNGVEELFLEQVDVVRNKDGEIYLENIFGHRKTVSARIKELQLVEHKIILERIKK